MRLRTLNLIIAMFALGLTANEATANVYDNEWENVDANNSVESENAVEASARLSAGPETERN